MGTITDFKCKCGNHDQSKAIWYDGMLGYEAMVCAECGAYYDHSGEYPADEWSKECVLRFTGKPNKLVTHE